MISRELTQMNPPRGWWSPLVWSSVFFLVPVFPVALILFLIGVLQFSLDYHTTLFFLNLYSFAAVALVVFAVNKYINKRSAQALGFHRDAWGKQYLYGVATASVLLAIVIGNLTFSGFYSFSVSENISTGFILAAFIGFIIQSLTEEIVFRGYLQNGLFAATSNMWVAIIGQAVCFALLHGMNPGITFFALLNLFICGVALGLIFWLTDSIWLVAGLHFLWNFALGPLLGIEVSGQRVPSPLLLGTANGSEIMTGGAFGAEASILTTIVFTLVCIAALRKIQTQAE